MMTDPITQAWQMALAREEAVVRILTVAPDTSTLEVLWRLAASSDKERLTALLELASTSITTPQIRGVAMATRILPFSEGES